MARRRKGRAINGVILVDKSQGESSNRILQQVKWAYFANKAGHTGALDPLATGMLPICLGEATKFSQFLLDSDKTYIVTAKLGVRTTTSDADGEVVSNRPVSVTPEQLSPIIASFKGTSDQMPSMFSALKHEGRPLYYYARKGIEVPRKVRPITVFAIEQLRFEGDEVDMRIHCSKGTYIRTIVDDMGEKLGCGAHVTMLRREKVAHYPQDKMIGVESFQGWGEQAREREDFSELDSLLLPMDTAVKHLPAVTVDSMGHKAFTHGNPVVDDFTAQLGAGFGAESGVIRVYSQQQLFLGVGEFDSRGQLCPKRVVNYDL